MKIVSTWWRENRPAAPTLFDDELRDAIERLKTLPKLGLEYESIHGEKIRRTR